MYNVLSEASLYLEMGLFHLLELSFNGGLRLKVLFNWEMRLEVDNSKQKKVLFSEQRMNIAYFVKALRGWNGTSLVLVCYFCKVACRNYATRVIK